MNDGSTVTNLNDFRNRRVNQRKFIVAVVDEPGTGALPFLAVTEDGTEYWCKDPQTTPHQKESVVNEVLVSVIGQAMGASVPNWAILEVPAAWDGRRLMGQTVFRSGPVFASENIPNAALIRPDGPLPHVDRDGNVNHIPKLYALWFLCNAEDIQVLYQSSSDMRIWSIDHGLWFGSHEKMWGKGDPTQLAGRPQTPQLKDPISEIHWDKAIESVRSLGDELIQECVNAVPQEWGVEPLKIEELARYALGRKNYTIEELSALRESSRNQQKRR
ncbi:HipA family kinase [uncultured Corynebacterium sp.]|uniref:HipA family kinase n=1 Tax=uncultured Corynebacterium sp. TaxID=159447 RepID=UPI0025FBEBBA|nr:HipA family kinase [uncultured Corynebacterium sp.]